MTGNVPLDSEVGQKRIFGCIGEHHATDVLQVWKQQSGLTLCGFQTLACIINSVEQTNISDIELLRMVKEKYSCFEIDESTVLKEGVTMDEFIKIARIITNDNSATTRVAVMDMYCSDEVNVDKEHIKQSLIAVLANRSHTRIACNYHMSTAGQEPYGGHFSPLVAFHEESDSFLILDVWPDTAPFWVNWEVLWYVLLMIGYLPLHKCIVFQFLMLKV